MKIILITYLLTIASPLYAGEIENSVVGVADLNKLAKSSSFLLSRIYTGSLSLQLGETDINHPKELKRVFNYFSYDASRYSEPDQLQPKLPAIFHRMNLKDGVSIGHTAFFDEEMQSIRYKLKGVATLKKFRSLVPQAIRAPTFGDEDTEVYWYSWAEIDATNRLIVHHIEVEKNGAKFNLWLWKGECRAKTVKIKSR